MFIDQARIFVRSGRGGDGMVHFHREKFVPRGGPDGGDGGRGGDVALEVRPTLNTLATFRNRLKYIAGDGEKGGPNKMTGKTADHLVVLVPPGTVVWDDDTNEILGDLVQPGQRLVVCKGGRGGRGNQHFASASNQAPTMAEKGEPWVEKNLRLELKLIADVGIVGVPNAGKSSLLAAATNAKPKIADYPFTTIEPNLGVAVLDDNSSLIMADIPGLIEGAHTGVGLGFEFLRHIQRTRVIIHLLDGLSEDPISDFSQINSEMALFDPDLAKKPQVVAINKMDLPDVQARWPELKAELESHGYEPMAVSAVSHQNLTPMLWKVFELLRTAPVLAPEGTALPVYRPADDPRAFVVKRVNEGYKVTGTSIERAAAMTYWEHDGSVRRFQKLMEILGVEEALRKAGVEEGDTVFIGEYELEWQD